MKMKSFKMWIKKYKQLLVLWLILLIAIDITLRLLFKFHLEFDFSPYIGVIIGASLGWIGTVIHNYISNNSEKKKRKAQIKFDLFATFHQFIQMRKAQIVIVNKQQFVGHRYSIYNANKLDSEIVRFNKDELDSLSQRFESIYLLLTKSETELVALQYEIMELYSDEINLYEFNALIDNVVMDANTGIYQAVDYTNVKTVEQINLIGSKIDKDILLEEIKFFESGEKTKRRLIEIFK